MSTGSFDSYPPLTKLIPQGGKPGVEYIYALAKNVNTFEELGYKMARSFVVKGQPMILMYRGQAIRGADVPGSRPNLQVDKEADAILGLDKPAKPAKKPASPGPTPVSGQAKVLTVEPVGTESV